MLNGLKDFALKKAYGLARLKGIHCGGCGKKLVLPVEMPEGGLDAEFSCGSCNWSGGLGEIFTGGREENGVILEKPVKCRVVESEVEGGASWLIPAKKGVGFLMIFGGFWLAISLIVASAFVFGNPTDSDTGEPASAWWGLFFIPFLVIGFGVLYLGLRMRWTEVMVVVDSARVRVLKKFFGKVREKSLEVGHVDGVWLSERYQSNDRPVYELFVGGGDGGGLTFGSELGDEDKRWLLGRMRLFLPEREDEVVERAGLLDVGSGEPEVFEVKGLRVDKVGDGFRVVRRHLSGKWMILGGILGMVFSAVFLWNVWGDMGGGSGVDLIFKLFQVIPLLGLGFMFLVCLVLIGFGVRMLGREDHFVFGKDGFEVVKLKGGVKRGVTKYARGEVSGVKSKKSGAVNDDPRYRVDVKVGGKKVCLCGFVEGEVADDLEAWVGGWISGTANPAGYGGAMKVDAPVVRGAVSGGGSKSIYRKRKKELTPVAAKWMLLFPWVFILVGAGVMFFGVRTMMVAGESEGWPSVEGRVTGSRVTSSSDSDGTTYGAKVKYVYEVDGKRYEGDRVGFGDFSSSNRSGAVKVTKRYSAGKRVEVFYRGNDPGECVLEKGVRGRTWFLPVFGLLFLVVGLVIFVVMLRGLRKGKGVKRA